MKEYIIVIGDEPDIMGNYGLKEKPKELVRCKDCKHWIGGGIDENDNFIPPRCTLFNEPQTSEWFCPEGQRMESD